MESKLDGCLPMRLVVVRCPPSILESSRGDYIYSEKEGKSCESRNATEIWSRP